ncbi:MAG: HAD family hydrolase [Clostridia bacterium]|nr:HAD family hydrolase [Clostridia bacterium]
MKYEAIFFDLDGTVVDSIADIADALNHTMRFFGMPERSCEEIRPLLGYGVDTFMRRILPDGMPEEQRTAFQAVYRPYYAAHSGDRSRPFPGILPMLEQLRARGLCLAILSNKPDAALQPLAERFFSGLVQLSAGEREGIRRKPCPDMLEAAARDLHVDLRRCLYVGDSEVDIDTANNARMDCVCVSWGFRTRRELELAGAPAIVDTPEELTDFILNS